MKLHITTPLVESLPLSLLLKKRVMLKMENMQPTATFKIRGIGRVCQQAASQGAKHFVTLSGGNAGYAVAYAGMKLNIPVTVFVLNQSHAIFKHCNESLGATVKVLDPMSWDDMMAEVMAYAKQHHGEFVHPFDHPDLWTGHASIVHELKDQGEKPDAIVLAVGGGGLLCGVMQGLYQVDWQDVPVITVETKGTASFAQSVAANKQVTLEKVTGVATSLGANRVADQAFAWSQRHDIRPYVVSDKEAIAACYRFAHDHHVLVEPACGTALSLLYHHANTLANCQSICVIVCGGLGTNPEILQQACQEFELI